MATDPPPNHKPDPDWDAWTPRRRRSRRQLSREEVFGDWYGDLADAEIEAKLPRAKKVGNLVDDVLISLNMGDKLVIRRLLEAWPELVGPEIARVSEPQSIQYKTLNIGVTDSVWLYRLKQEQRYLQSRIIEFCGDEVRRIRLVPGGRTASR